jgi:hypothetical protein
MKGGKAKRQPIKKQGGTVWLSKLCIILRQKAPPGSTQLALGLIHLPRAGAFI